MTTWQMVHKVHREHPDWNSALIAERLGCGAAYVRATANRRGWRLGKKRKQRKATTVVTA